MAADWLEVQSIATVVLVITSASAIVYAGLQLRSERAYRSVANLEKQLSFFLSDTFAAARKRLAEARLDGDRLRALEEDDPPIPALEVLDFYEHLALLVKKGHLELYDVWHTFYEWAQPVYIDLQPVIESEDGPFADHYNDLRSLMRQMDEIQLQRMHKRNANHWALWTPDRILEHYRFELEAGGRARRARRRRAQQADLRADMEAAAERTESPADKLEAAEAVVAGASRAASGTGDRDAGGQ